MKRLLLSMLLLATPFAHSGEGDKGNGGDVIECPTASGGKTYELADYYEARTRRTNKVSIELGPRELNYQEKVNYALNRMAQVAPHRAKLYQVWFSTFLQETEFVSGEELVDIPDSSLLSIPKNCKIRQAAVQLADKDILFGLTRYTINGDIWEQLDSTQKAGLVLHELIYREAIGAGHGSSLRVRYLNSLISSAELNRIYATSSDMEVYNLFESLGFKHVDIRGLNVRIDGPLEKVAEVDDDGFKTYETRYRLHSFYENGNMHITRENSGSIFTSIEFNPDGTIKAVKSRK